MRSFDGEVFTISDDTKSTPLRETDNDVSLLLQFTCFCNFKYTEIRSLRIDVPNNKYL